MAIGSLRKIGKMRFPTIRRSTDVLQPESGDVDFSEALKAYDEEKSRSIAETEVANKKTINENEEKDRQQKKKKQEENENEEEMEHIDVEA